jgi:hypothetical protein
MSFIATPELNSQMEQWAKDEERTMSATLRRILEDEALRREAKQTRQEVEYQTN